MDAMSDESTHNLIIDKCLWKVPVMGMKVSSWNWLEIGQEESGRILFYWDSKSRLPGHVRCEFRSQLIH